MSSLLTLTWTAGILNGPSASAGNLAKTPGVSPSRVLGKTSINSPIAPAKYNYEYRAESQMTSVSFAV